MSNLQPYSHYTQTPLAMAGFFSWLRKAVNKVVNIAGPFLPPRVFEILDDFTDGDGSFLDQRFGNIFGEDATISQEVLFRPTANTLNEDFDLSTLDESILDEWVNTKFLPYYNTVLQNVKEAQSKSNLINFFIAKLNNVSKFIAFLDDYIIKASANPSLHKINNQLSTNGVLALTEFLKIQSKTLQEVLTEVIETESLSIETVMTQVQIDTNPYQNLLLSKTAVVNTTYNEIKSVNGSTVDYNTDGQNISDDTIIVNNDAGVITEVQKGSTKVFIYLLGAFALYQIMKKSKKSKK
jgi:hypothetical protein